MKRPCATFALVSGLLACSESSGTTGATIPPLAQLSLFPDRWATVVGDAIILKVTARDLQGVDRSDIKPKYTSSDSNVVGLDPAGTLLPRGVGTATVRGEAGGMSAEVLVYVGAPDYDVATLGPPRVLSANYIDLSKIERISRFRSAIGHSYTTGAETCRSMKHYYQPKLSVDWTMVDIYAPTSGTIWIIATDGAFGYRLMLRPRDLPAMYVHIFHVTLNSGIVKNAWVNAGDHIGRHASSFTMSDIATGFGTMVGGTLLSYFETMTDAVFAAYQARGVASREAAIITKAERDADPVPCVNENQFTSQGTIPNWVDLTP